MAKIYWKVGEAATGRYRSFAHRSWPTGYSDQSKNRIVSSIRCDDEYVPVDAKSRSHAPLKVYVAIKNVDPEKGAWSWCKIGEWKTLNEAKSAAERFYSSHSEMFSTND